MLILNRHKYEQIQIGDDIVVVYLGTNRHGRGRIGVQAPKEIPVTRMAQLFRPRGPRAELTEPPPDL